MMLNNERNTIAYIVPYPYGPLTLTHNRAY